jgi:hypothetical protein
MFAWIEKNSNLQSTWGLQFDAKQKKIYFNKIPYFSFQTLESLDHDRHGRRWCSSRKRRHLKCYLSHKFPITACGELSNHTINDTRIQLTTTPTSQPDSLPSVIGMIRLGK